MNWIKQTWKGGYRWLMILLAVVAVLHAFKGDAKVAFWSLVAMIGAALFFWLIAFLNRNNP